MKKQHPHEKEERTWRRRGDGRTLTRSHPLPPLLPVPSRIPGGLFTPAEWAAAELLVQLSGSTADSGAASAASSSPRSVNTRPPAEAVLMETEEEDEDEAVGLWRRTKRYRPIADLYAATRPIEGQGLKWSSACGRR